jgi:hypothetical protein
LANASFFSLFAAGVVLVVFFGIRTFQAGEVSYQRAITTAASANATLVNSSKNETATLKSLDLQGDKYQLVYQITLGPGTTTIVTDSAGTQLISAHRQ